jgi:hypothetical protein
VRIDAEGRAGVVCHSKKRLGDVGDYGVYFVWQGICGRGRVGGGPGHGGRFWVDMLSSLQRMAIEAVRKSWVGICDLVFDEGGAGKPMCRYEIVVGGSLV